MENAMHRHRLHSLALITSLLAAACTDAPPPIDIGLRSRTSAALRQLFPLEDDDRA